MNTPNDEQSKRPNPDVSDNPADDAPEADSDPGLTDGQKRDIARADLMGKAPDINPVNSETNEEHDNGY
jgi:hypothetical protein